MIGPKLDARSYAILILAVIGTFVAANLIAQTQSSYQSQAEIASATREVATATREVAQSNAQIAEAIQDLASAMRDLGDTMDQSQRATGTETEAETGEQRESGQSQNENGVFELN